MCTRSLALLVAIFVVPSAFGQSEAWRAHGTSSLPSIGTSVAWLADVNGDGVPDYVAGGPAAYPTPSGSGHALIASGADGAILFDLTGAPGTRFGTAVARAGDADGDGLDDVAVGAPLDGNGAVDLFSGATGASLQTLTSSSTGAMFGSSLAYLGDVDGDGVGDFAVGAPLDASSGSQLGVAEIVSGASGAVLASWTGASVGGNFGSVVADAGDLDGDGRHDLLVIEQDDANTGELSAFSSATLQLLWKLNLGPPWYWIARSAGDTNGDGVPDVIVGNSNWPVTLGYPFNFTGGVWIYDGKSGALIRSQSGQSILGWDVSDAGDQDGDGFADYAYGNGDYHGTGIEVVSGQTGTSLGRIYLYPNPTVLGGGVDVTGDGVADLLMGTPYDSTNGEYSGAAGPYDFVHRAFAAETFGTTRIDSLGRASALLDDVDGDGTRDVLVGIGDVEFDSSMGMAVVLSGVDGHVVRTHVGAALDDSYAATVAALPDLDGDGIGEYAVTVPGPVLKQQGRVEIRSGATGSLIQTLTSGNYDVRFGASCAVAIQPSGAVQLAVGAPGSSPGAYVFDVASGNLLLSIARAGSSTDFGTSIAYVGDVDGDGVGDWVAGGPDFQYGYCAAEVFSGATGNAIWTFTESGTAFGAAVGGPGDLDGDGVPDVLVGAQWEGAPLAAAGAAYAYSGATGNLLHTWTGTSYEFGSSIAVVGDVNRDGVADFLVGQRGNAFLFSGGSGAALYRFDGALTDEYFGAWPFGIAAPGSRGSMNGDTIPDVTIGAIDDSKNGSEAGRLSLYFLDDLYLQIQPPRALAGTTAKLTTSGGPASSLAALFVVAFDTTPLVQLCGLGKLDAQGLWTVSGKVPAGLSGHTVTLASFTVGFAGKVVGTQPATFTFR